MHTQEKKYGKQKKKFNKTKNDDKRTIILVCASDKTNKQVRMKSRGGKKSMKNETALLSLNAT